jgi:hypothetical protein
VTDTEQSHTEHHTEDVSTEDAHAAWAASAREMLIATARRYHHVITAKELAAGIQERTGMTANQRAHYWIGSVLALVAQECASRGEPNLSSLCVNAEGSVGRTYAATVTGGEPDDPDTHAANERLACHVHFDAPGLPAAGGVAVLTGQLSASRSRVRKAARESRPVESCPRCFMVLPSQGPCLTCE